MQKLVVYLYHLLENINLHVFMMVEFIILVIMVLVGLNHLLLLLTINLYLYHPLENINLYVFMLVEFIIQLIMVLIGFNHLHQPMFM